MQGPSAPAKVYQRPVQVAPPTAAQNRLLPLYDGAGTTLTFADEAAVSNAGPPVFHAESLMGGHADLLRTYVQYPCSLRVNLPWALSLAPGEPFLVRARQAIFDQLSGPDFGRTRCTQIPHPQSFHGKEAKCGFTRYFTAPPAYASEPPPDPSLPFSPLRHAIWKGGLDNFALFPEPYLIVVHDKETDRVTQGGQQRDRQRWYAVQFCTNCLFAGTIRSCGHRLVAQGLRENRPS
ncbi:hypothetical protein LTR17_026239 [Elasticomyces elasticus]|nr:hypothetical protein LTR17_026239 [Elasticomyces elasticus]